MNRESIADLAFAFRLRVPVPVKCGCVIVGPAFILSHASPVHWHQPFFS